MVAHDGVEAVEKAQGNDLDIILMNFQMPVMDGLEAMRHQRAADLLTDVSFQELESLQSDYKTQGSQSY
jgi:CheY-like chemotaxis protein